MKHSFLILALPWLLLACKPTTSSKLQGGKLTPPVQDVQCSPGVDCKSASVDRTDYSRCTKIIPVHSFEGNWNHSRTYNKTKFVTTTYAISASGGMITVTNECSMSGEPGTIKAKSSSPIVVGPTNMAILNSQVDHQQTRYADGRILQCDSQVNKGDYNISFYNSTNCLILGSKAGQSPPIKLVPGSGSIELF